MNKIAAISVCVLLALFTVFMGNFFVYTYGILGVGALIVLWLIYSTFVILHK